MSRADKYLDDSVLDTLENTLRPGSASNPVREYAVQVRNALLYAYDAITNCFLMLDVFGPNAHEHPKFQAYVRELQDKIVQPWIKGRYNADFEPPEDYEP
ncbi:hypothetical protein [Pseudomonas viridiflava]|uniref:hypothetical protein n=1 Tax=Pseudomonas viridiflava TaxID=33069 RepID=UPI002180841C|nr:hypothetical protein [Pseudomonas viridiflava]